MNPEEDIFEAAAALHAEDRAAHLDSACAGQPELRARIEVLLRADEATGFMEKHTAALPGPPVEQSGERIGRYRLLQQIGEGGFGTVWMAEQVEPVTRRVALKIIKAGMDTREVIARFKAERQALAMMDHPNISRVFDAGATDKGRPFFVMELVKGIPITKFCDEQQFTTRQRLELFGDVCSAINHAHQKGIIHRDIKPSNVMVTLNADRPVVKVIDFGIAKATQGKLTDRTLFTRFGQFLGTPAYMSPEQAANSDVDIDTRSDIYALGVLLYELLTGKPPFDAKTLVSAGYEEMRRIIREVEPARPSIRLNTIAGDERTVVANARQCASANLSRLVEPDLDWIVMKAIEKDRARRYETANGLALDIQRFLAAEPVSAGPPSAAYRFRKFARRHKVALLITALVVAVLLTAAIVSPALVAVVLSAATAVSAWQAVRATMAQRLATSKARGEKAAREDAEAVSSFLFDIFQCADPARDGRKVMVVDLLDRAAVKIDSVLAEHSARRARFQAALGRTYHSLGLYAAAVLMLQKACDGLSSTLGSQHRESLNALRDRAASQFEAGDKVLAHEIWERLRESYLASLGPSDPDTLGLEIHLAQSYYFRGKLNEAFGMRDKILEERRTKLGTNDPETLGAMHDFAQSCFWSEQHRPKALKLQEDVLLLRRQVSGDKHPEMLWAMHNLADYYALVGRMFEALELREALVPLREKILGSGHQETLWACNRLASSYISIGRWDDASALMKQWIAPFPEFTRNALTLCAIHAWRGKITDHLETSLRLLDYAETSEGPAAADHAARGYALIPSSNPQLLHRALQLARRAVSLSARDPFMAWYQIGVGMAEYRCGNYPASEAALLEADRECDLMPPNSVPTARTTAKIYHAMNCFQQGKVVEARRTLEASELDARSLPVEGQSIIAWDDQDDLICWLAYKEAKLLLA